MQRNVLSKSHLMTTIIESGNLCHWKAGKSEIIIISTERENQRIMKKVFWIFFAAPAIACGDGSGRSEDREAAAEEEVDAGAGEEISPQLELDSADNRFNVDTVSSTNGVQKAIRTMSHSEVGRNAGRKYHVRFKGFWGLLI